MSYTRLSSEKENGVFPLDWTLKGLLIFLDRKKAFPRRKSLVRRGMFSRLSAQTAPLRTSALKSSFFHDMPGQTARKARPGACPAFGGEGVVGEKAKAARVPAGPPRPLSPLPCGAYREEFFQDCSPRARSCVFPTLEGWTLYALHQTPAHPSWGGLNKEAFLLKGIAGRGEPPASHRGSGRDPCARHGGPAIIVHPPRVPAQARRPAFPRLGREETARHGPEKALGSGFPATPRLRPRALPPACVRPARPCPTGVAPKNAKAALRQGGAACEQSGRRREARAPTRTGRGGGSLPSGRPCRGRGTPDRPARG